LLHQAGIPESVLQFLPVGGVFGEHLLPDPRVAGVVFTGSTSTAQFINLQLAQHHQAIVPLIAETGGQNVLIADSSALLEQLVQDAVVSAFNSAGQRCSALRVLFVQEDIADKTIAMLIGAMQELSVGNPGVYQTDIGPIIDHAALAPLSAAAGWFGAGQFLPSQPDRAAVVVATDPGSIRPCVAPDPLPRIGT
jgi:RHH-type proline utilization regulon transcriptional repressor/proline dehydrogenase/delta 1-pyrroline-5-carboxylate dehydrogenase